MSIYCYTVIYVYPLSILYSYVYNTIYVWVYTAICSYENVVLYTYEYILLYSKIHVSLIYLRSYAIRSHFIYDMNQSRHMRMSHVPSRCVCAYHRMYSVRDAVQVTSESCHISVLVCIRTAVVIVFVTQSGMEASRYTNEPCHTWMSRVKHEWVMSQTWMHHITHECIMVYMRTAVVIVFVTRSGMEASRYTNE